jgi:outer membrane murein-binding lipoprotein Lpp
MTAAERTNVLLEDIRAQNRATYEALSGQIEGLERRMGARFDRLEERVTLLENVVRKLHEEVQQLRADVDLLRVDVNLLRVDVNQLRVDVNQLRADFDNRAELSRLDVLERRVTVLEKRRSH